MDEIEDFIAKAILDKQLMREERVYLTDEARKETGLDVHYYVREIVDPQVTIREKDLNTALEMARRVGFKQGTLMDSIS